MTLREWCVMNGYARSVSDSRIHSPFGPRDSNPSCYMNDNFLYDFRDRKSYSLHAVERKFGVKLDYVKDGTTSKIQQAGLERGEVLFPYNFGD